MNNTERCCVLGCPNTYALTRDTVSYYRFPSNDELKQKWLDAINWANGEPNDNHYVCGDHFEATDLTSIGEDTTMVPTIYNPEFVAIKEECEQIDVNLLKLSKSVLLEANDIKMEIDCDSEQENCNFESNEIVDSKNTGSRDSVTFEIEDVSETVPKHFESYNDIYISTSSDDESDIPLAKRMKIENNLLNKTSTLSKRDIQNINLTKQVIGEEKPKFRLIDLSKVSLKLVAVQSDNGTKMVVKTVDKSLEGQSNPIYGGKIIAETEAKLSLGQLKFEDKSNTVFGTKTVPKTAVKLFKDQSLPFFDVKTVAKPIEKLLESQSKPTYGPKIVAKTVAESCEAKRKLASAPGVKIVTGAVTKLTDHHSKQTYIVKKIVNAAQKSIEDQSKSIYDAQPNAKPSQSKNCMSTAGTTAKHLNTERYEWDYDETKEFLKYMLKHIHELPKQNKSIFWEKTCFSLKEQGVMKQTITADKLCNKWKVLKRSYQFYQSFPPSFDVGKSKFPFMKELNEILRNSVKFPKIFVNSGLPSSLQNNKNTSLNDSSLNVLNSEEALERDNTTDGTIITSENETDSSISVNSNTMKDSKRRQWLEEETRTLLKYVSKNKYDFLTGANRKQKSFFEKMESDLKRQGALMQSATADQLSIKCKVLMKSFRHFDLNNVNQLRFQFIDEIKEILLEPIKSHNHTISIGLTSFCHQGDNNAIKMNVGESISLCPKAIPTDTSSKQYISIKDIVAATLEVNPENNNINSSNVDELVSSCPQAITMDTSSKQYISINDIVAASPRPNARTMDTSSKQYVSIKDIVAATLEVNPDNNTNSSNVNEPVPQAIITMNKMTKRDNDKTNSLAKLKQIYLQKKIEGRELKNKLLRRLLNDQNSYNVRNGIRVVNNNK